MTIPIRKLTLQEKTDWIRLSRSQNVGPVTFFNLLKIFGTAKKALDNIADFSLRGGLKKPITICLESEVTRELESSQKIGAKIICFCEAEYPKLLREIADPPIILTGLGDLSLLNRDIIAVVGPRNPSLSGCKFAHNIAQELGRHNLIVASGLAKGIDTAAHKGSLEKGTIAVIAGGIDNIYPPENAQLYQKIAQNGLIISENSFGSAPKGGNFPQRNRIISGISIGTVVVEATLKSGTLITARFTIEQNRELFAVPGSPFDPRCQGTNRLIKQGAKLTENVFDILEELENLRGNIGNFELRESDEDNFINFEPQLPSEVLVNDARELILEKLNSTPIAIDEIILELQIPVRVLNIALVQLELADRIENKNGKVSLKY